MRIIYVKIFSKKKRYWKGVCQTIRCVALSVNLFDRRKKIANFYSSIIYAISREYFHTSITFKLPQANRGKNTTTTQKLHFLKICKDLIYFVQYHMFLLALKFINALLNIT